MKKLLTAIVVTIHLFAFMFCIFCVFLKISFYHSSLPSAAQRLGYADCLEVKQEYYQNCLVLDCVTQCSQLAAHLHEHAPLPPIDTI